MAYTTYGNTGAIASTLRDRLITRIETARADYDKWRTYRNTVSELAALSNRDLADLGLSRSMIRGSKASKSRRCYDEWRGMANENERRDSLPNSVARVCTPAVAGWPLTRARFPEHAHSSPELSNSIHRTLRHELA